MTEFRRNPRAYVYRAAAGERIRITRWGKPVAMLVRPSPEQAPDDRLTLGGRLVPPTAQRRVLLGEPEDFEARE